MTVIDEQGNQQTWTAVYWRYHSRYEYEADSPEEALSFLKNGEDYGELSSECILGPDREVLIPKSQIHDVLWQFGEASQDDRPAVVREITGGAE